MLLQLLGTLLTLQAAQVDTIVHKTMAERRIPGVAVAVARGNQIVFSRSYGVGNLELETPVNPKSTFLIASITKTLTAVAVLQLVQEKKLDLDAPIERYLGTVPAAWKPITVRHLLTHTGGLKDRFELTRDQRLYLEYSTHQMRAAAEATPVDTTPAAIFQYSDQGYVLLGLIIERVSGQTYRQFLTERIFRPAGMTGATTHTQHEVIPGRVPSYIIGAGRKLIPALRNYHFGLVSHYGVMATAEEMALYGMALLEGKLLPSDLRNQMWTPGALADSSPARTGYIAYGLGWFLEPYRDRLLAYHSGSTGTALFLSPSDSLVVVVLTNLEQASGNNAMTIAQDIAGTFVPELTRKMEPSRDPDSTLTLKVKNTLAALAAGTADSTVFTAGFWRTLRPQLSAQSAGLSRLGSLTTFTHLYTEPMGSDRVVAWSAGFPNEQWFVARAVVKPDGRIDWLGLER
jgi:CubicO group peptidase (beta-lactamase class C family)